MSESAAPPDPRDRLFETGRLQKDLGRRTALGGVATAGGQVGRFGIEAVRIVLLARLLEPSDYGVVAMVTVVTSFLGLFTDFGLTIATITRERITHLQVSTLFWVNVGLAAALAALTIVAAPLLAWFYQEPRVVGIALLLAPTFVLRGLAVQHQAVLRRQMRFVALVGAQLASQVAGLAVGFWMAFEGFGYWALVALQIVSATVSLAVIWALAGWIPGRPTRGVGVGQMLRVGANVMGTNFLTHVQRSVEHMLLGRFGGAYTLGIYTKAQTLVETPIARALGPFGTVVVPSLSRVTDDPARYRRAYLRILEKLVLVAMPGSAFMVASAERLVPFALGEQWTAAGPIFAVLALRGFISPVMRSTWWIFVTQNRTHQSLRWSVVETLGMLCGILGGMPWGALGVAIGVATATCALSPLVILYAGSQGPVRSRDIAGALVVPGIAAAAAVAAQRALAPSLADWQDLPAVAALFAVDALVFGTILCAFPSGRAALADALGSIASLRRRRHAA